MMHINLARGLPGSGIVVPVFALMAEQVTPVASNEAQSRLDQANGPAAQIVRLPASIGNARLAKQALCNVAIAVTFQPPVHCTHGEDLPMPGPDRLSKRRPSNRALFEPEPESMCSLQTEIEIAVERQVESDQRSVWRILSQPKPMPGSSELHDGMPPIRRLTKLVAWPADEIESVRT
ncbi:hypothetical protein ACVIHF_000692 [Bradyrhizobium sp. USDA 4506]